ncbi:MAG: hypothetical protein CMO01_00545 [Thalassobius sp.]|nr:hypothetical protein [Thalassovita sp.]
MTTRSPQDDPNTREARLEALVRSLVPRLRLHELPDALRRDLFREFTELRGAGRDQQPAERGRVLFTIQGIDALEDITVTGCAGLAMLLPDDHPRGTHLVACPSAVGLEAWENDISCLRSVILDPATRLYTGDFNVDDTIVTPMSGCLEEDMLPDEGLYLKKDLACTLSPEPA